MPSSDAFQYQTWDGQTRYADADALWRNIIRNFPGPAKDFFDLYNSPVEIQKANGTEAFLNATRRAFAAIGMPLGEWNGMTGEGASDGYVLALFRKFNEFLEKKNPKAAEPPISSPVSDSSTIPNSNGLPLDCGLTPSAQETSGRERF